MFNEFEAARRREADEFRRDMRLAWHIEALHRQKRLAPLRTLLKVGVTMKRQTPEQQRSVVALLAEAFGGRMSTKADRERVAEKSEASG